MKREWTLKAAKILVMVVGCVALVGVVVMSLWNALVPDIFGGTAITWVQALGLLLALNRRRRHLVGQALAHLLAHVARDVCRPRTARCRRGCWDS